VERMQLAIKVLSWRYNGTAPATDAEIERLRSYLERDASRMNALEIAAGVISLPSARVNCGADFSRNAVAAARNR
jgi:hypothetical protein